MKQAVRHLIRRMGCGHEILCKAMAAVSWYLPAKEMHLEASLNWWDDAGWGPMTYMVPVTPLGSWRTHWSLFHMTQNIWNQWCFLFQIFCFLLLIWKVMTSPLCCSVLRITFLTRVEGFIRLLPLRCELAEMPPSHLHLWGWIWYAHRDKILIH